MPASTVPASTESASETAFTGPLDDEAKRRLIDELSTRLAAIEAATPATGGRDAGSGERTGSTGTAPPADRPRRNGRRERDRPVAIGASGTAGPTRPDRRRGGEPAGHPEDDLGDPESVARSICLRLLAGAARPRAGLAAALRLRGIPDDVADRVLDRFTEVGLIDDQAYAEAFVAAKHRERALGATALRTELRRKGVDEDTVLHAVRTIDQDAERERARALIAKRLDAAMAHGESAARRRLVGLLARRGYPPEVAFAVVDEALVARGVQDGWTE